MKVIDLVVRIEKATGLPALFILDDEYEHDHNKLTCFTFQDSHSIASTDYYRNQTRRPDTTEEDRAGAKLLRYYSDLCANHGELIRIKKRLVQ